MIVISRRAVRRFRAACARCGVGRTRGPAPPVVIRQQNGCVTLTATFPETTLELACVASATGTEVLLVPMAVLDEIGGATDDPVQLECTGLLKGTARWNDTGKPRTHPLDLILPGKQHDPPGRPQELKPVPERFLTALHEAGRTSSRDDGRFALSRVQVRGAGGQVIATDGKIAVIFGKFSFPFTEDVLVPAIPLFGCPELRDETDVRVGRTPAHLVVSAGDWTVWWAVAPAGKFPDVAAVIPRQAPTTVVLDRVDAAKLLPALPHLPGQSHDLRPVTLDIDRLLTIRGRDDTTGEVKAVVPAHATVTGPALRLVLDRRALARVLALGCNTLRLTPNKALVGLGDEVTVLVAPLDPQLAAPITDTPKAETAQTHTPSPFTIPTPNTNPERNTAMKPPDSNGSVHHGRRDPSPEEPPDPLVAAEELRDALSDVLAKATRLITVLKASRKEKKVLASVWAGLKQLNLAPNNGVKP